MPYIHIPQHRCARISTETPVDIEGLYTSGVFNCAIIILYSPDRTRSSMIHADASVEWRQIQTEIDWVGSGCEKFIIKTPAENSIEDIMSVDQRKTFRELPVREGFWGTALSRHGCQMIHYYLDKAAKKVFSEEGGRRKLGEPNMHRHPHEAAIKEIFLFNGYCPYFLLKMGHPKQEDLQYQFIIYDVNHWPKRDLHELQFTKFAHDCYTYLKDLSHESTLVDKRNAAARMLLGIFFSLRPELIESVIYMIDSCILDLNQLKRQGEIPWLIE